MHALWTTLAAAGIFCAGVGTGLLIDRPSAPPQPTTLAQPAPASVGGGTLTLAAYNIHNFFDTYDNPYTADEGTEPKSPAKLRELAEAILQINADVLIMEEVEHGGLLKKFADEQLKAAGYHYVVDEPTDDPRGICVAAVSKLPITRIVSHRLVPLRPEGSPELFNRFARDLLRLDVQVRPGYEVSLLGVHLKSKLDAAGDPQGAKWRLAEAIRARALLQEMVRREGIRRFVILGDFNDTLETAPVQTLLGTTDPPLTDALAGLKKSERVTFVSDAHQEGIDFALLSPELGGRLESGTILRGGVFETASDHRPVRVKIKLP